MASENFCNEVGLAKQSVKRTLSKALTVLHGKLYGVPPITAVNDCLEAVRQRELTGDRDPQIIRLADASTAKAGGARPWPDMVKAPDGSWGPPLPPGPNTWIPLRHFIIRAGVTIGFIHKYVLPRWEYEAVVALDNAGHIARSKDNIEIVAAAKKVVLGDFERGSKGWMRWDVDKNYLASPQVVSFIGEQTFVLPDITRLELSVLLAAMKELAHYKARWRSVFDSLPSRLFGGAIDDNSAIRSTKSTLENVLKLAIDERHKKQGYPCGDELEGVLDKNSAFRWVKILAQVLQVLLLQVNEKLQRAPDLASIAEVCNAELELVVQIALSLLGRQVKTSEKDISTLREYCGINKATDEKFLALVAPGQAYRAFAWLPLQMVIDSHHPTAANRMGSGPLFEAFQAAQQELWSRVTLQPNLFTGTYGELVAPFIDAVRQRRGPVWVQPSATFNTSPVDFGINGVRNNVVKDAITKVQNAAELVTCVVKDIPITVLLPRFGSYASKYQLPGQAQAFGYPDGSGPDFAFPAYASAFLRSLLRKAGPLVNIIIITDDPDLAKNPRDSWLEKVLDPDICPAESVVVGVNISELVLDFILSQWTPGGGGEHAADYVLVKQGSAGNLPLVRPRPSSDGSGDSEPLSEWMQSSENEKLLSRAGLRLLHVNMADFSLKAMEANTDYLAQATELAKDSIKAGARWRRRQTLDSDSEDDKPPEQPIGLLTAVYFSMGDCTPDWSVICNEGRKLLPYQGSDHETEEEKAAKRTVAVLRETAIAELTTKLESQIARPSPVVSLFLEHAARSGGTVALMQFGWKCFQSGRVAVIQVEKHAWSVLKSDDVIASNAAAVAHLASTLTAGPTNNPLLVLLADRDVCGDAILKVVNRLQEFPLEPPLRIAVVRAVHEGTMPTPPALTVKLGKPSTEELIVERRCRLNIGRVLAPYKTDTELLKIIVGHDPTDERVFRRTRGFVQWRQVVSEMELMQKAMAKWVETMVSGVYVAARTNPKVQAALHALMYVALITWCGGEGVSVVSMAGVLRDSEERDWLYAAARQATSEVLGAALKRTLENLRQNGSVDLEASVLPFFPEALAGPDRQDLPVSRQLEYLSDAMVSRAHGRVRDNQLAGGDRWRTAAQSNPEATRVELCSLLRDPATQAEDIWLEMMMFKADVGRDEGGFMELRNRELAALFLRVAFKHEGIECPPTEGTPNDAGPVGPPEGIFALTMCLLRAVLRDETAVGRLHDLANEDLYVNIEHSRSIEGRRLEFRAQHVFRQLYGTPDVKPKISVLAIDMMLEKFDHEGNMEAPFKSMACRAMLGASAVYSGRWQLAADTARLMLWFLTPTSADAAEHDVDAKLVGPAERALPRADFIFRAAALHAAAKGQLQTALNCIANIHADIRKAGTHDMLGNGYRHLNRVLLDVRLARIYAAAGVTAEDGKCSLPEDAKHTAFAEIADMFVLANLSRCQYAYAIGTFYSGASIANEADLWITCLEIVNVLRGRLILLGVNLEASYATAPLAALPELAETIFTAVNFARSLLPALPRTVLPKAITSIADAASMAGLLIEQLTVIIRNHHELAFNKGKEKSDYQSNLELNRYDDLYRRYYYLTTDGDPRAKFEQACTRLDELEKETNDASTDVMARTCAECADKMWSVELDHVTAKTTMDRFSFLRNAASEDVQFVLGRVALKYASRLGYHTILMMHLIELAAVVKVGAAQYAKEVLDLLKKSYNGLNYEGNSRSVEDTTIRLFYASALFCNIFQMPSNTSDINDFHGLNGVTRYGRDEQPYWHNHDKQLGHVAVHPLRLMMDSRAARGIFVLSFRRRFTIEEEDAACEASDDAKLNYAPQVVEGKVLWLKDVVRTRNGGQFTGVDVENADTEGVIELSRNKIQLRFLVRAKEKRRLIGFGIMPFAGEKATAFVDAVSVGTRTGIMAEHVQAGEPKDRLPAAKVHVPAHQMLERLYDDSWKARVRRGRPGSGGTPAVHAAASRPGGTAPAPSSPAGPAAAPSSIFGSGRAQGSFVRRPRGWAGQEPPPAVPPPPPPERGARAAGRSPGEQAAPASAPAASSRPSSARVTPPREMCRYFASGRCLAGSACRYGHALATAGPGARATEKLQELALRAKK